MLTTVTLNPALDRLYRIGDFQLHKLHRLSASDQPRSFPGGKGVNIALGLESLGASVLAMGIAGGYPGRVLVEALHESNLSTNFIFAEADTRTNIFVIDPTNRTLTEISEAGPPLAPEDQQLFVNAYQRMLRQSKAIVLAGSLPVGASPDLYGTLLGLAHRGNLRSVLHCAPALLEPLLSAGAHLICPDMRSTHRFRGTLVDSVSDFSAAGRVLLSEQESTELVVFLNRIENVVAVGREQTVICRPRDLHIESMLGYADSLLAGLIFSLHRGHDLPTAAHYGCAAGLASVESMDKLFGGRRGVEAALSRVTVEVTET